MNGGGRFPACKELGGMSDYSFPARAFFIYLFYSGDQLVLTYSTLYARISPHWLIELRQLWLSVF